MQANLQGRVKNVTLAHGKGLLPLFEAVVNSRDAILELDDDVSAHHIEVRIMRERTLLSELDDPRHQSDAISGFEVIDDGLGFDDDNYGAFNEADTQRKAQRGGKGVGRFLWLKAFDGVEIESDYEQNGQARHRRFTFSLQFPDGMGDVEEENGPSPLVRCTSVRLLGLKEEYRNGVPTKAQTIAHRMVEHCLQYFLLNTMPHVTVVDEAADEDTDLDQVYDDLFHNSTPEDTEEDGQTFHVTHFLLKGYSGGKHSICYCADDRLVLEEAVGSKMANLPARLRNSADGEELLYVGYVTSSWLDEHANQERTAFEGHVPGTLPGTLPAGELTWPEVEGRIIALSREFLRPFTEGAAEERNERIREYVTTEAPQYRYIVEHHPERLDQVPLDASGNELDTALHQIKRQREVELREEGSKLFDALVPQADPQRRKEELDQFSKWWDERNADGKSDLARYIVYRKQVLAYLQKALTLDDSGHYQYEDVIHQVIFPLKRDSREVTYEEHNLWVIDERLSYHQYLSSDMPLKSAEPLASSESARPDLLVFFDHPIAVAEGEPPFSSGIVLFEFKRPMRDDNTADENPIRQVLDYVDKIRRGKIRKEGRLIAVSSNTPFYCYVVADLTDSLKQEAKFYDLPPTPDGTGFAGYHNALGAYVEVIPPDRLVRDARRRNKILFDKLGLT